MSRYVPSRLAVPSSVALVALALAGCTAGPLPDGGSRMMLGGSTIAMPVRDMVSRKFLTVVRQQFDFSCGSAALATLLTHHYGDAKTETAVFAGMWKDGDRAQIRRLGFSLLDMKRYLDARGMSADGYRVTLDQIASTRVPGVALIDANGYKHFVVVKGVDGGQVLVGDPALGLRMIGVREFAGMWNGIYFALNDTPGIRKASFGRANEWALVPRAPSLRAGEPVSLQALSLTRPLPGEI